MAVSVVRGLLRRGHDVQIVARTGKPLEGCPLHLVNHGNYAETATAVAGGGVVVDWGLRIPADVHRLGGGPTREFREYNLLATPPVFHWLKRLLDRLSSKMQKKIHHEESLFRRPQDRFIAVSEFVAKQVRENYPVGEDRMCVIHNGVDVGRFSPTNRETWRTEMRQLWGVPEDAVLFMFVAHNPRLKNFKLLARVFRRLHKEIPLARLVVVGKHRVPCMGDPWLVHAGAVAVPEKAYAAADVLLHPTFFDACANVVLEAMASELPVVSSDLNGSAEMITSGHDGFVLPVHGADSARIEREWTERVRQLAMDSELRTRIGAAARKTAESHTMAAYIDALEANFARRR